MKTVFTTAKGRSLPTPPKGLQPRQGQPPSGIPPWLLPADITAALCSVTEGEGLVEEIRLRAGREASLPKGGRNIMTSLVLTGETLTSILVHMCGGSLYAFDQTIREGYITLPKGIRVGVAGRAVCEEGRIIGVCEITGLCIRLPHVHRAVGQQICRLLRHLNQGSNGPQGILVYAPPGEGKTTLLRGVSVGLSGGDGQPPLRTVVVDTRGELGFETEGQGLCLDILRGYPRARGVEIATRTLSAQVIICDEIGDTDEALSLISTHHGGVPLVATAHGGSVSEILRRTGIRLLHEARLFGAYVGIKRDGYGDFTYRITPWCQAETVAMGGEEIPVALPWGGAP